MVQSREKVTVKKAFGSEHQLVAARPIAAGEQVLCEEPIARIDLKAHYQFGDYCWELVDALLSDTEHLKAVKALKLLPSSQLLDETSLAVEAHLVSKHKKSRQLVRELYFLIGTNNVGILTPERAVKGYGIYSLISRADHSCAPNARLEPGEPGGDEVALFATRAIKAGEPITWSYFREDEFLQANFETRNEALVNYFRFACRCERCKAERPPELAHVRDLVAYFDEQLKKQAIELSKQPGGLEGVLQNSPLEIHRRAYSSTTGLPLPR